MPTPDPRAVLERLYDALNRHDLDDFCEVMTPDVSTMAIQAAQSVVPQCGSTSAPSSLHFRTCTPASTR
jgi:ketosteroid isomerase-like protein